MTGPGRGIGRATRGSAMALSFVLLALAGHVLGGGSALQAALGDGLAALGVAWVLSRGEAALWNLYRVLQLVGVSRLHALAFDGRPQRNSVATVLPAGCGTGLLLASACVRRGPPRPPAV